MPHQLDEIDQQILNILVKNGRTPYADLAKEVGMKSPSVIERIKKLESEGILKGYSVDLNYKPLGYDIIAFIGISIDNAHNIAKFEKTLVGFDDDIVECHHVTGDYTMLVKVITKNTETLSSLIKKIRNIDGVQKTNTMLVFSSPLNNVRSIT